MGKTKDLGHLAHIVAYNAENHITVPAGITMHTNQLVASQAWVTTALGSYALSSSLSSYVPTSRTITINGTTFDLSDNRNWDITSMIYPAAGIALSTGSAWGTSITNNSDNWNTAFGWGNHASAGYLTGITSAQVTTALGFTPVTNARTITINGTTFDLSADRSYTISAGTTLNGTGFVKASGTTITYDNSTYLTGITSALVTGALGFTPYNATNPSGYITSSGSISGNAATATNVAWSGVTSKPSHIMYYQSFTLDANTMDVNATGFTYAVNAPFTGPIVRFSAGGSYDMWLNATYSGGGNSIAFRTRNGDTATLNPWREIIHTGNIGSQSVANSNTVASRSVGNSAGNVAYYDANGNLYVNNPETYSGEVRLGAAWGRGGVYTSGTLSLSTGSSNIHFVFGNSVPISMDSNGTINIGGSTNAPLSITGAAHKYLTINPGNGYEAMVRYIGGSGSGWYVGKRTSGQLVGTQSFHFYSEEAGATVGGIDPGGVMFSVGAMRAPIFYDHNDTGYYLDPNSESSLYRFTSTTMTRNAMNYLSINSPFTTRAAQAGPYQNGTMGWGTVDFNTVFSNWGSGFIDTWSSPGNAPGGSSHYVGIQSCHYNHQNSANVYGFQMACAGEADNRFFWRSAWPSMRGWVEMMHTGNISSYSVPTRGQSNWNDSTVINNVVGMLAWKNYGNSHVIFDASQGTSPSGSGVSQVNATYAWTASYPTLMGWNGSGTYGVRVDSARIADSTTGAAGSLAYNATADNIYNYGWFRNYGDSGLYNQDYGCHFRRNAGSSHGSWEIFGYTKAGYVGLNLVDAQGFNNNLMFEQGRGGVYQENGGGWHFYYDRGNDCIGLSGSETYDWVRACTNGKHRITNDTWCDATSWAYTFSNISDGRLKENIVTVDSALDKVLQLRGVYYNWIIDTENKKHIGLIAQETAAICPEVVNYHDETDTYSVNYSELSGLFVESTKELNQKLMDANARIELLETKLNELLNA